MCFGILRAIRPTLVSTTYGMLLAFMKAKWRVELVMRKYIEFPGRLLVSIQIGPSVSFVEIRRTKNAERCIMFVHLKHVSQFERQQKAKAMKECCMFSFQSTTT